MQADLEHERKVDGMNTIPPRDGIVPSEAGTPTIVTYTGIYFPIFEPDPKLIHLNDIAFPLSRICRFVGQCKVFYSVAEHSVEVSRLVSKGLTKAALFHDAAEAYLGDVSRPLKRMIPEYPAMEDRVLRSVFEKFEIRWPNESEWKEIKRADNAMLSTEAFWLCGVGNPVVSWGLRDMPSCEVPKAFSPQRAVGMFLREYRKLFEIDERESS